MDILIYALVLVAVMAVIVGGVWLANKFGADKSDIEFAMVLLGLVNYISMQIDWKYKQGIADIMGLVMEAMEIIVDTVEVDRIDTLLFKEYVLKKAEELCEERGLDVDDEFVEMLDLAVNYLIK